MSFITTTTITDGAAQKLQAQIEQDCLVALCGAGLSMGAPSAVPPARQLAEEASATFQSIVGQPVPPHTATDLERLADYFLQTSHFPLFVNRLVKWEPFRRAANAGHATIADFLCCNALDFAVTTNFDELIELAASTIGEDFLPCLDGTQLNEPRQHRPLLKLHGCVRDRLRTLWCNRQLTAPYPDPLLPERIESAITWLKGRLLGRSLLLVGFWTDWAYLNELLFGAIRGLFPPLVVLVDPLPPEELRQKANQLWEWANSDAIECIHIQASGSQVLDQLRSSFSRRFVERLLHDCADDYRTLSGDIEPPQFQIPGDIRSEEWYQLRRDICGVAPEQPVREKRPATTMFSAGVAHLLMLRKGAVLEGSRYRLPDGPTVRVINGHGRPLSAIKRRFNEESAQPDANITICAGSFDDGNAAPNVVRSDQEPNICRSAPGGTWVTLDAAINISLVGVEGYGTDA
jgi:hypothetical protein